jgi:hypothetical protein
VNAVGILPGRSKDDIASHDTQLAAFGRSVTGDEAMSDQIRRPPYGWGQFRRAEAPVLNSEDSEGENPDSQPPAQERTFGIQRGPSSILLSLVIALGVVFTASVLACLAAEVAADGWPLSVANLEFALEAGCWLGASSVPVLGIATLAAPPAGRHAVALGGAVLWALVGGFCFFVITAACAAC